MSARVLMICTGNVCRSPIAQALLSAALPAVDCRSAGTHALVGQPADPIAVQLMAQRGIDLQSHIASALTEADLARANVILTMTRAQHAWLAAAWPACAERLFLLGGEGQPDIVDPHRRTPFTFELATAQIEAGIALWLDRIRAL